VKNHLVDHLKHRELVNDSTLHVIGVVSNPARWHSRYRLARQWMEHVEATPNVRLYMVESAFGDRHHEVTETGNPRHLQRRTRSEIWNKENLINLGVRHLLPLDWRYLAWVDADVEFRDPEWALDTLHQLQHFGVVQPWQSALDLGPTGNVLQAFQSFGFRHQDGGPKHVHRSNDRYPVGHCGFAWACTRTFWEAVGGLIDFAILGSADYHMSWAMVGEVSRTIYSVTKPFHRRCVEWQQRALRVTHGQVGYVQGRLEHHFHGPKQRRYYKDRWKILIDSQYDPDTDLMYDSQGLIQLCGRHDLEHAIRQYNRSRHEDSIEEK
jgi:hypothetical protein